MGALYAQRMVRTTLGEFDRWRRRYHYLLVGASPSASTDDRALTISAPATVLLMGEERKGLSPDLQARCDQQVRIPMFGGSGRLTLVLPPA